MKKLLLTLLCLSLVFYYLSKPNAKIEILEPKETKQKENKKETSSSKKIKPTRLLLIKTLYDFAYQMNKEDYDAAAKFFIDENDIDMQKLKLSVEIDNNMTLKDFFSKYLENAQPYKGMRFQKYINKVDKEWKFGKVSDIGYKNKHKDYIKYIEDKENCYMMCDSVYQDKEVIALWKDEKFKFCRIDE